ncbi:PAS domain-containing hybrid sensor histidine kinase/response regulator [Verrucomicrobiota bacterium sgz303538]
MAQHPLSKTLPTSTEAIHADRERLLSLALDAGQMGVWVWDLQRGTAMTDAVVCRLFGMEERVEYPAEDAFRRVHSADSALAHKRLQDAIAGNGELDFEFRVPLPDGTVRWLASRGRVVRDANGEPVQILGVNFDLTARKQAEEEVRESEERYRTLFESIDEAFCVVEMLFDEQGEPVDYRFVQVNPAFEAHTGLVGATGKTMRELAPKHEAHWFQIYGRVALTGESIRFENCADQLGRWFDVFAFRTGPAKRRQVGILFTDITARRQAEEARRAAQAQAESALQAKDNFLATLSHELRTPLTPVLMTAASLAGDQRLPDDVREQLGMIERNVALEARLIDDLLDLTRITRGKLPLRNEPCDVHSLIAHAVEIVRDEAQGKSITLNLELAARKCGLSGDPARLQQVFWNLLKNAVKFTPRGGRITVGTRDVDGTLELEVSDSGVGFTPSDAEGIFHPFEQGQKAGDHRFGGLGLGLAIAKAIVELHGGSIRAESAGRGSGATFVIDLPNAYVPTPQATGTGHGGHFTTAKTGGALRLLVVEDHEPTLSVVTKLLQRAGHHVVTAQTVNAALTAAESAEFDVVISDLGLPDGTGVELMSRLRTNHPDLRGIALSGYGMEEDVRRSHDAGFETHLTKPVNFDQLRQALDHLR